MIFLLVIIYIAFISLGLPDSLLGSAWPTMYQGFKVSISSAGMISMTVAIGTIVSSLFSEKMIKRFGTGTVTLVSVTMTAIALLGISLSNSFLQICLWAIPLGLGAGSVDAALNNFVALHYKAVHMNWLHSFWGVGTIIGPLIISQALTSGQHWSTAYQVIAMLQGGLVIILLLSLPLWKKVKEPKVELAKEESTATSLHFHEILKLPKAKVTLIAFFCYCALEQTVMLWGSSYMVSSKMMSEEAAAGWIALFFVGITAGRFTSGLLSLKFSQKNLIQLGQFLIGIGLVILMLPLSADLTVFGLLFVGAGCAPIFPSLLHETPNTFGKKNSQAIMGIQMAAAYLGTTLMPPFFWLLSRYLSYDIFPIYLSVMLIISVFMILNIYHKKKDKTTDLV